MCVGAHASLFVAPPCLLFMGGVDLAFFMLVLQLMEVQLEELELDLLMFLKAEEDRKEESKFIPDSHPPTWS